MKHLGLGIVTYLALVLQSSSASPLPAGPGGADFLLAAAMLVLCRAEGAAAIAWAAAIGLLSDCLGPGPLGPAMISMTAVAWGLQVVVRHRAGWSKPLRMGAVLMLVSLVPSLTLAMQTLLDGPAFAAAQRPRSLFWSAVGTVAVFLAVELVLAGVKRLWSASSPQGAAFS